MRQPMRRAVVLALMMALGGSVSLEARTVAQKKQLARTAFEQAERMREALNGRPEADRTVTQYRAVMEAYRKVYYIAPTSLKADAAVVAVAELLADAGRQFRDEKMLRAAIGQYEFLRREYPGSRYRVEALFTIAEIYYDNLDDEAKAKETYQEFLKHYPHSELAEQARTDLAELNKPEGKRADAAGNDAKSTKPKRQESKEQGEDAGPVAAKDKSAVETTALQQTALQQKPANPSSRVLVTGVRHWSTPDYTRVAVDLNHEVEYSADRIDNPDRLYFDLHNAKLSSVLVGKSFDVDDGFLKKIRVAQYQVGEARVVLEIAGASEYSAFLLPNPYRLIIDIHGKNKPANLVAEKASAPAAGRTAADDAKTVSDQPREDVQPAPVKKITDAKVARPGRPGHSKESDSDANPPEAAKLPVHRPPADSADAPSVRTIANASPKAVSPVLNSKPVMPDAPPAKTEVTAERTRVEGAKITNGPLPGRGKKSKKAAKIEAREAAPIGDGDRTLIRALGLKIGRIVVDAGHGGHDTGTIGPNGILEKDLVLDVALRLGKLLETRLGAEVTYTRDDDTFIPLETRTAIANQKQADLFISVHANSSNDPKARGVETYYLNFTSSPAALEVAARENAVSDKSIHELQDLVKKIALKDKIDESKEFAANVESSLYSGLAKASPGIRNRGVKKAPFIVLIGANMPSILSEISFVSNPTDARKLQTPEWRQKIAESLYHGVAKYVSGLSGLKVAAETKDSKRTEQLAARP